VIKITVTYVLCIISTLYLYLRGGQHAVQRWGHNQSRPNAQFRTIQIIYFLTYTDVMVIRWANYRISFRITIKTNHTNTLLNFSIKTKMVSISRINTLPLLPIWTDQEGETTWNRSRLSSKAVPAVHTYWEGLLQPSDWTTNITIPINVISTVNLHMLTLKSQYDVQCTCRSLLLLICKLVKVH